MAGLNLWKGRKTNDFSFQDRISKEITNRGGTAFIVHKYVGPFKQDPEDSTLSMPADDDFINELTVQDVLFGENRDRKYSDDLIECRGTYALSDMEFELSQFGANLGGDIINIDFHANDLIEKLGRKLMSGDVVEVVHLRDETSLDADAGIIKKFYVVQDATRPSSGYGTTWYSHMWKVRCSAIVDTQEFRDILHNQNKYQDESTLDWLTNFEQTGGSDAGVSDNSKDGIEDFSSKQSNADFVRREMVVIDKYQREEVEKRMNSVYHLYIKKGDEQTKTGLINWMFNGNGTPENFMGDVLFSGDTFPEDPEQGDYFIRTDYVPARLFKRTGLVWRKVSEVWREDWQPIGRLLSSFINNDNVTTIGIEADQTFPERQALSDVVKPKTKQKPIVPVKLPEK